MQYHFSGSFSFFWPVFILGVTTFFLCYCSLHCLFYLSFHIFLYPNLHWLPVSQRINYEILLLTYKALNGQAPSYITELLEPYVPTRNLRSSSKNLLKVPSVKLVSYGHRCFSFVAPSLWNSLIELLEPYVPRNLRSSSKNLLSIPVRK